MQIRKLLAAAGSLTLLFVCAAELTRAQNQAPFTIRYPPDGARVREKVRIRVPMASIPENGYVSYRINDQFIVALTPTEEQRNKAKKSPGQMFEFVWDTKKPIKLGPGAKTELPKDGEYTVSARLFGPVASGTGSEQKSESSVRVFVANTLTPRSTAMPLTYKFANGRTYVYNREGETEIVGGLTQGLQAVGDQELFAQKSSLDFAIEDLYANGHVIARNRMTSLSVRQGGQEIAYPLEFLPRSLYQEIDSSGAVHYQTDSTSQEQFVAQLGLPVNTSLELPSLPKRRVKIGDSWSTARVALDIPGTAPDKQPRVTVTSTFEGFEWEGGRRTAKITERYNSAKSPLKEKEIVFGTILVQSGDRLYPGHLSRLRFGHAGKDRPQTAGQGPDGRYGRRCCGRSRHDGGTSRLRHARYDGRPHDGGTASRDDEQRRRQSTPPGR
jgi:hypothetical protein